MRFLSPTVLAALTTAVLLAPGGALAGSDPSAELRVAVRNVKADQGSVMVALFKDAASMEANRRLSGQQLAAQGETVTAVFTGLPAGRYAVAVYQDLDGDGALTSNLLGIPQEPYGFGGDPAAGFGPPAFDETAVPVAAGPAPTTVTATLSP